MSGSVPKTPARRAAISGDTGTLPFTIPDTCLLLTPRASAVCVIVTPSGAMYICLSISPGWAGFCIRPGFSMVVLEIHRRLMLVAMIGLLPPAFGRLVANVTHQHVEVAVLFLMFVSVLSFAALDAMRHGRLQPAFLWGGWIGLVYPSS